MVPALNSRGHAQTLVAAHAGNSNALNHGAFSPAYLRPLIESLAAELAPLSAREIASLALRIEIAALMSLNARFDASLTEDGVLNRKGEPRTLVDHRHRGSRRLLEAVVALDKLEEPVAQASASPPHSKSAESRVASGNLLDEIAVRHGKPAVARLAPDELDPDAFLFAVIESEDAAVRQADRRRARHLLAKRQKDRPPHCLCFQAWIARDDDEFARWVAEFTTTSSVDPRDQEFARWAVRLYFGRPDILDVRPAFYHLTFVAVQRIAGTWAPPDTSWMPNTDPVRTPEWHQRFWDELLDEGTTPQHRLGAFDVLDGDGALRRCTCRDHDGLGEEPFDAQRALVIGGITRRDRLAAELQVRFPQTLAVVLEIQKRAEKHQLPVVAAPGCQC